MKINAVIFDFNGTLFWDTKLHNKAWDIFLEKKGIGLSDQEKNARIHGKNNEDILRNIIPVIPPIEDIKKMSLEKERIYQDLCFQQSNMPLAPGAEDLLYFLLNHSIAFTIATASESENVDFYFRRLALSRFFDKSKVIYNDGQILSKPNPHIFQEAIRVLGVKESETLVFEDSIAGIIAAENARVRDIIIVNSSDFDYSHWNYQIIKSFAEVDKNIFF